jgi:hypothetical protein
MVEMTQHVRTTLKYDGPALSEHQIDVQDLAPALMALGNIVQAANRKFNGDRVDVRVLVNADVDQKCFMIDLSLAMSLLDQAKTFFDSDRVKTAKEIAEWIGLVAGGSGGLFALLKLVKGRGDDASPLQVTQVGGLVTIVGNGNTIVVPAETYALAQDKNIVEQAKVVMRPLAKPGYTDLSFVEDDKEVVSISDVEAEAIISAPSEIGPAPTESVANISGVVRIKSAQYEGTAKWSLLWNGRPIDAEMVDAAAEWVADFQANKVSAPPNTVLEVSMTETVRLDENGLAVGKPRYVVSEVRKVTPPPAQIGLL